MKYGMQWITALLLLLCCMSAQAASVQRIPDDLTLPDQATMPDDVTLPDIVTMGENASNWAKDLVDTSIIRDSDDPKLTLAIAVNATLLNELSQSGLAQAAERLGQVGQDGQDSAFTGHSVSTLGVSTLVNPIPAAAWLFGSALGLLGWVRGVKQRKQLLP